MKKKTLRDSGRTKSPAKRITRLSRLRVVALPGRPTQGIVLAGGLRLPVALGRAGIRHDKREGDGATPAGTWHPRALRFRADHGGRPATALPARRTRPEDGWCDDPADGRYNQPVRLPFAPSHEEMWRADGLYDLVIVLDHNARPRRARRGSAVFLHLAREGATAGQGFVPTAGCIAFRRADLRRLLPRLSTHTRIVVG
ncbi:L,D-transpeptidase family protein [Ancylobacter pratisalsi]|uniref:L,D-transpeptidase family protein n=1 Tax=Ancylobacter pratisalsi TaxID=1745854 RepID=UPI001FEB83D1|nr:L,D-transpeptidase family protein [Ancylobacter pratisalsi]